MLRGRGAWRRSLVIGAAVGRIGTTIRRGRGPRRRRVCRGGRTRFSSLLVILCFLRLVGQYLVCCLDQLESGHAFGLASCVAVRMVNFGKLAIRLLDILLVCRGGETEVRIVVSPEVGLGHGDGGVG